MYVCGFERTHAHISSFMSQVYQVINSKIVGVRGIPNISAVSDILLGLVSSCRRLCTRKQHGGSYTALPDSSTRTCYNGQHLPPLTAQTNESVDIRRRQIMTHSNQNVQWWAMCMTIYDDVSIHTHIMIMIFIKAQVHTRADDIIGDVWYIIYTCAVI